MRQEKLYVVNLAVKEYYSRALSVYASSPEEACEKAIDIGENTDEFINVDHYRFQTDPFAIELFVVPDGNEHESHILNKPDEAVDLYQELGMREIEVPYDFSEEMAEEFV